MRLLGNRWLRLLAALAWMGVIFFLSAQSRLPDLSPSISDALQNVMGHFIAYAILAWLVLRALEAFNVARPLIWTVAVVLLYALSDEIHQAFVPGRHPDPLDIATDLAGALMALAVTRRLRLLRQRPHPR